MPFGGDRFLAFLVCESFESMSERISIDERAMTAIQQSCLWWLTIRELETGVTGVHVMVLYVWWCI